ncbi:hypothetical protein [Verrucomicrobium sp. BvORR034]|uniref:hypothetical protein n=1 Tax=Verrucomicrobium sp. BvORR034 TaxID=1396418 RepID=UPI000678C2DD|nr:hypothetical protein [Verrucomicrobium sp. BvORR034]
MKLADIFHSFGSRIASLKKQGKAGEARALILERDKAVTQAEAPPPVATTPSAPTSAPAVTAKPTSAPAPVAVDHSATIATLNTRLASMEKEIAALKTENATLKAGKPDASTPTPPPVSASNPKLITRTAFNMLDAKAKADYMRSGGRLTDDSAAQPSASPEGQKRIAELVLQIDQCRTNEARTAFMMLHGEEVATLLMANRELMSFSLAFPNWTTFAKRTKA